jgi:hypothetical protein
MVVLQCSQHLLYDCEIMSLRLWVWVSIICHTATSNIGCDCYMYFNKHLGFKIEMTYDWFGFDLEHRGLISQQVLLINEFSQRTIIWQISCVTWYFKLCSVSNFWVCNMLIFIIHIHVCINIQRIIHAIKNPYLMAYQPEWPHISPRAEGPEGWYGAWGLICHAIWILACIILFIIYHQAKITEVNEEKNLNYLIIDLIVVTYFFIVTSLICSFCMRADIDMHFLHGILIWVIMWRRQYHAVQILHNYYQVCDKNILRLQFLRIGCIN